MEYITYDILKYLKNEHTKVESKEDFKGNYYSYVIDTIYIGKDFEKQKVPSVANNINKRAAELVVVCHECIHSIQSKSMHILNTIFSNLSIVLAIIYIVMVVFWTSLFWLKITVCTVIITSIIVRLILEIGAINGSTLIAEQAVLEGIVKGVSKRDIEASVEYIKKYRYLALLKMIADKIIFLILVLVIK